jgi:hypothetical protein
MVISHLMAAVPLRLLSRARPDRVKDETLIDFNSMERAVAAEQVKMLVAQSPTGIVMSFLLASFVAMVFGELVPGRFVFI